MKIIHKYILKELTLTFMLSLVALNVVMMSESVMRTSFMFAHVGASAMDMAKLVTLIQPQTAIYTIPLALMVSIMLTYGRLNATSELTVLRTSGMRLPQLARPAMELAWTCLGIGLLLSCLIAPAAARLNNAHIREVISTRAHYAIEEGIFTSAFRDVVIFVEKKTGLDMLGGVFIHDSRDPARPRVVTASSGIIQSPEGTALRLALKNGTMHMSKGEVATDIHFERYVLSVPINTDITRSKLLTAEMTPTGLIRAIPTMKTQVQRQRATMTLHRRFTMPLMSLCVALFAIPLSLMAGKTGKLGGLGLGFGFLTAFYVLSAALESAFRSGNVPAIAAGWIPIAVMLAISSRMYWKESSR